MKTYETPEVDIVCFMSTPIAQDPSYGDDYVQIGDLVKPSATVTA